MKFESFYAWTQSSEVSEHFIADQYSLRSSDQYTYMGINCLFPFVKKFSKEVNINCFSGKIAAVDASCWMHKALATSVSQTGNRER